MTDDVTPPAPDPPPPPAPPAGPAPPATGPPPRDTIGTGVLRLLLLHLWQIPLSLVAGPVWIGISQLAYVIPQALSYRKQGRSESLKGLWIGAGVTFLLNAGCFGLVLYSLAHTSFR
jgi:hypothetical protein